MTVDPNSNRTGFSSQPPSFPAVRRQTPASRQRLDPSIAGPDQLIRATDGQETQRLSSTEINNEWRKSELEPILSKLEKEFPDATTYIQQLRTAKTEEEMQDSYDKILELPSLNTAGNETRSLLNSLKLSIQNKQKLATQAKKATISLTTSTQQPIQQHTSLEQELQEVYVAIKEKPGMEKVAKLLEDFAKEGSTNEENQATLRKIAEEMEAAGNKLDDKTRRTIRAVIVAKGEAFADTDQDIKREATDNEALEKIKQNYLLEMAKLEEQWIKWLLTTYDFEGDGGVQTPNIDLTSMVANTGQIALTHADKKDEAARKTNRIRRDTAPVWQQLVREAAENKEAGVDNLKMAKRAASEMKSSTPPQTPPTQAG